MTDTMADIQAPATDSFFASGRYSKRKRTQVNYCPSELDLSDNEEPDFDIPKSKKSKAQSTSRPLPKRKIFPFLDLPAEIRNIIYTYALTDPNGINLVATFKHKRRTVERVDAETMSNIAGPRRWTSARMNDSVRRENPEPVPLMPSLLAVNKQINQEARDLLYSSEFIFADTFALYAFLVNLGPEASKNLQKLRLLGWGYGRGMKAYNHASFALLAWATNITSFAIEADKSSNGGWRRSVKSHTEQLYRDAFPFLEAIGRARGKPDAGVELLEYAEDSFGTRTWNGSEWVIQDEEKQLREFKTGLSKLLLKQQERLLKVPKAANEKKVKKRKAVVNEDSDDE